MPTPDQRRWCLTQAIEIVKQAPADSLQIHDRLKRIYKRLLALCEQGANGDEPRATTAKGARKT
jgi:hypothetical protein